MMDQCACPTKAEQAIRSDRFRHENVVALTRGTAIAFHELAERWPNAAEFMASLVVRYGTRGMTWEEAAHWIVRAQTEPFDWGGEQVGVVLCCQGHYHAVPEPL